ncbi:hypothetical protein ACFQZ8_20840 [Micromonospora azadirachtae]|uniref:Lipoprotein n=1 Tax=Micromonospora azadirachtae TaxID=1970735 RepID=A0ABW3A616_9ACTN
MRRLATVAALTALLAGCSPDTSALDAQKPVQQKVTLEVALIGPIEFFDMLVQWGHNNVETQEERTPAPNWVKDLTLTWPDDKYVYVTASAQKKPSVDDRLAFVNGQPSVECRLRINGQVVETDTSAAPQCDFNLSATPPPGPSASAG